MYPHFTANSMLINISRRYSLCVFPENESGNVVRFLGAVWVKTYRMHLLQLEIGWFWKRLTVDYRTLIFEIINDCNHIEKSNITSRLCFTRNLGQSLSFSAYPFYLHLYLCLFLSFIYHFSPPLPTISFPVSVSLSPLSLSLSPFDPSDFINLKWIDKSRVCDKDVHQNHSLVNQPCIRKANAIPQDSKL